MPTPQSVAQKLLPFLQDELNDTGVELPEPPVSLQGGFETELYRFKIAGAPSAIPQDLVLRIYPGQRNNRRAEWECALHNSLFEQGLPVPKVFVTGAAGTIWDEPFIIMEFLQGHSPVEDGWPATVDVLGSTQARLHSVDAVVLENKLKSLGFDEREYSMGMRLSGMKQHLQHYPWLADIVQWLTSNLPPQPDQPAICHNDFHPLNLLVQDGQVSAIFDWSNFAFGYPIMDVAFTTVILTAHAPETFDVSSIVPLLERYRRAYTDVRPLDDTYFDYFRVFRGTMALFEGAGGQSVWTRPLVVERLCTVIHEVSRVNVSVPG